MNPTLARLLRTAIALHMRSYTDADLREERASTVLRKALLLRRPGNAAVVALADCIVDAANSEIGRRDDLVRRMVARAARRVS